MRCQCAPLLGCLLLLTFMACQKDDAMPTPPPATPDVLTYLALGDSYTIGTSVPAQHRWPSQLRDSLQMDGFRMEEVTYVAQNGWTTDELDAGIDATSLRDRYDLVSLLIGVNNQFRDRPLAEYRTEFEALLLRAIEFAGGDNTRVFVVSIPDYAFTPFGQNSGNAAQITAGIDEFNAANRAIAEQYNVAYFDITPISREGVVNPQLVASDGLHPSFRQYQRWVSLLLPGVKGLL